MPAGISPESERIPGNRGHQRGLARQVKVSRVDSKTVVTRACEDIEMIKLARRNVKYLKSAITLDDRQYSALGVRRSALNARSMEQGGRLP